MPNKRDVIHSHFKDARFINSNLFNILPLMFRKMASSGIMSKNQGPDTKIFGIEDHLFRRRVDQSREQVFKFEEHFDFLITYSE